MGLIIGDSAYPPAEYPVEWNGLPIVGWGFYIGGNTPHVWTDAEVAALKASPHIRYLIPIFTRSEPGDAVQGRADALAALDRMRELGQQAGTIVQLDYETAVDPGYEEAFDAVIRAAGYLMELYGSAATVVKNPRPSGGYDEASWTGKDYAPSDTGDQFTDAGPYDLNDFRPTAPLWDLHPASKPPVPTPAPLTLEEDTMMCFDVPTDATEKTRVIYLLADGKYLHVAGGDKSYSGLEAAGVKTAVIDFPLHEALLAAYGGVAVTA